MSADSADEPLPVLSVTFVAVLRVAFSDIDEPSTDPSEVLFNEHHARQVMDFVRQWRHVDRIVVHCMAGQSRSPGMALGLSELFSWETGDLEERYPFWNPWQANVCFFYSSFRTSTGSTEAARRAGK